MAKYSKNKSPVADKTQEEAAALAKSVLKPSEAKQQRKLVEQGIHKGIEQYKKQYKAKVRDLDKRLKKAEANQLNENPQESDRQVVAKQHWLPWVLLGVSWVGFILHYLITNDYL